MVKVSMFNNLPYLKMFMGNWRNVGRIRSLRILFIKIIWVRKGVSK
jgi:hypothetical protein